MPEYTELLGLLSKLREDNGAESLYLGYTDVSTMKDLYLVDASLDELCYPGTCDDIQPEHIEKSKTATTNFPRLLQIFPNTAGFARRPRP